MKLILQIKLNPTSIQSESLIKTIRSFNRGCNQVSGYVWDKRLFRQYDVHHLCYYIVKKNTDLPSQLVIRAISKVVNSYKTSKRKKHSFQIMGSVTYDSRVLSYKKNIVSISSVDGRLKIPFNCYNEDRMKFVQGESDLIYRKGKFFLMQTIDIPDEEIKDVDEFLGVDLGQKDIASTSEGKNYSSKQLNTVRDRYYKVRNSVQAKGTRSSKRLLKRLRGREQRFASITNHTIAKSIVSTANKLGFGIAVEDLTGIRKSRVRKSQKRQQHSWSFYQLRQFIEYKARLLGIPVIAINPQYTSQTCNRCRVIGVRKGKYFTCRKCGNLDADINAAKNISLLGLFINQPERSTAYACCLHS